MMNFALIVQPQDNAYNAFHVFYYITFSIKILFILNKNYLFYFILQIKNIKSMHWVI